MAMTIKRWMGLGLGTAVLGTALVACSDGPVDGTVGKQSVDAPVSTSEHTASEFGKMEGGESGEGESGDTGHGVNVLPREMRLAFMMAHVEAGLALYRAGELEMAAPHLLHPVSETHISEREGLEALGFEGDLFSSVSKALEAGIPATTIEPQLIAAEENLRVVAGRAGGDTASIIRFLMETLAEEYTIAVTDGVVTDPGEYQDAYGFAVVAKQRAADLEKSIQPAVVAHLNDLISMWPSVGPIPPRDPAPIDQVIAKTSQIQLSLPAR